MTDLAVENYPISLHWEAPGLHVQNVLYNLQYAPLDTTDMVPLLH